MSVNILDLVSSLPAQLWPEVQSISLLSQVVLTPGQAKGSGKQEP